MDQKTTQAIVIDAPAPIANQTLERLSLFNPDGTPMSLEGGANPTGASVLLTGYTIGAIVNIAATDTVNQAFGKLMAAVVQLQDRVYQLENP